MKYANAALLSVLLLAGCGDGTPVPPSPSESTPSSPASVPETPEDAMDMTNIEMFLWPSGDSPEKGEKPLLIIRAKGVTGSMASSGAELSFEGAQAVVPPRTPEDSQINFEATRGTFMENQRAVLKDGVRAQIDDMSITLDDITWEIPPKEGENKGVGMAFSDKPLKIVSPTQNLDAARLRLFPDTRTMELYDVTGVITFAGAKP